MIEQMWDLLWKTTANPLAGILLPLVAAYVTWRWLYEYLTPWGCANRESLKRDIEFLEIATGLGMDVATYRESCCKRLREHFNVRHRKNCLAALVVMPSIVGTLTFGGVSAYFAWSGNNLPFLFGIDVGMILLSLAVWKLTKVFTIEFEDALIPSAAELPDSAPPE